MAKRNKTVSYTKAVIDMEAGTITEYLKDEENVYSIENILQEWNGVEGITLSIKQEVQLPSEQ